MPIEGVLGHVLESSQLRGRVFCMSSGRAPWGLRLPARSEAVFHLVTMGNAVLLVGAARHALGQGDLLIIPTTDRTRADEPWLIVTGHTLMIGDLGRTELAVSAEDGARDLFRSVEKLRALPDYLEVLPGAYAGSACGRSLSANPTSTLGFEKRYNVAFRIESEAEFIRFMLDEVPPAPPDAARLRAVNSGRSAAAA